MSEIKCCPHCGDDDGYYNMIWVKYMVSKNWDGSDQCAEDMDGKGGIRKRCSSCHKDVTKHVRANDD